MKWDRPVPVVGDTSSAAERAENPKAWALGEQDRAVLYKLIRDRRDIRRFRPDPVDDETLLRVLGAAHGAPSVGHSQPWRFIVVDDAPTRDRASLLANRERLRQAHQLEAEATRHMLDLQLDGIREAPIGIVIACDRRPPPGGILGRATFGDSDLWSCACAIENLWLAARAEGLGLGWVTFFKPEDLCDLLGLPERVETLGWLCLGWPDERPPTPGLERAGWSSRLPLEEVIVRGRWPEGDHAPPISRLRAPDQAAVVAARDDADALLTPLGSLGVIDFAVDRFMALEVGARPGVRLVIAGADHPITADGVSTFSDLVTREVLEATVAGESLGATTAKAVGATVCIIDAGIRDACVLGAIVHRPDDAVGDLVNFDGLSARDVKRLLAAGRTIGKQSSGSIVALGEVGIGNTTVAATLAAVQLGLEAEDVAGLGAGGDFETIRRKHDAIATAVARARATYRDDLLDPMVMLGALGGPEFVVLAGVVLGASESNCLVMLDGLATSVAALAAVMLEPSVASHLVAGQQSRERAHPLVLAQLGLEPLLDARFRAGEGVGALLVSQLLVTAITMRHATGRVKEQ